MRGDFCLLCNGTRIIHESTGLYTSDCVCIEEAASNAIQEYVPIPCTRPIADEPKDEVES